MDWGTFGTLVLQGLVVVGILTVVGFVLSAVVAGVVAAMTKRF